MQTRRSCPVILHAADNNTVNMGDVEDVMMFMIGCYSATEMKSEVKRCSEVENDVEDARKARAKEETIAYIE